MSAPATPTQVAGRLGRTFAEDAVFAPLRTERFTLRALKPADAEALHRLVNDWEVVRMLARLPFPYPRSLADEFIASTRRQLLERSGFHLAIAAQDGVQDVLLGVAGLRLDRKQPRVGSLGYWVGRPYWGHGVATEAAGRLARWAMANLDLDRLTASADRENPASMAVLRRIGFREQGEGREIVLLRGGQRTVRLFAASRDDLFGTPDVAPEPPPAPAAQPAPPTDPEAAAPRRLLLVAACALIDADGRVLLARRPEGRPMAGLWEFPGGKLGPGETPEEALIRELHEELAIDVAQSCLAAFAFASHAYERFHLLMPLYLCRRWRGTPVAREGQTLAWVRPGKLAEYDMPPADKPLIPLLRDFL
jgi:8-oxo-dGTP diphosphatase